MKIIRRGHPKTWWEGKRAQCSNCGTFVELEAEDTVYEYLDAGEQKGDYHCPECQHSVTVYKNWQTLC